MIPRLIAIIGAAVLLLAAVLPATAQPATPTTGCPAPSPAEAEAIATRYFDAFNTGDVDALDALLAPDYRHHGAIVTAQDRELHKERVLLTLAGFPDLHYTIEELMTDGDLVLVRHTMRGTHDGAYAGLAPTGTAVEVTGIHIHRLACGVITETWNEGDGLWLYQQLGLAPPPAPTQASAATPATAGHATPAACADLTAAEIADAWFDAGWERGDIAVIEALLADDHRHHWAIGPESTVGTGIVGERIASWRGAFPDLQVRVEGMMTDGDLVAMWWSAAGTSEGPFMGAPPTGAAVTFSGINIFRVACGEVVEVWSEMSTLHLYRQLGLLPPVATPAG